MDVRQYSLPAGRNREPILGVLKRVIAPGARVLEIASGSGEHAVYFAKRLEDVRCQPSDPDADARASIAAWTEIEQAANVAAPLDIDVSTIGWERSVLGADAIVAINMIHISPWEATIGLMRGAGVLLGDAKIAPGVLFTYGPYKRGGRHTAPSNEAFDAWLKQRDPRYGVRDMDEVEATANLHGLRLREIIEMPANNFSLVFER